LGEPLAMRDRADEISLKYAGYIDKQKDEVARVAHFEKLRCRRTWTTGRCGAQLRGPPEAEQAPARNPGQASRISGVTPAPISLLLIHLKKGASRVSPPTIGSPMRRPSGVLVTGAIQEGPVRRAFFVAHGRGRHEWQFRSAAADRLQAAAHALDLVVDAATLDRLLSYVDLLQRWNATYNLTAVRDPGEMLTQHLVDCLAVVRPWSGSSAARAVCVSWMSEAAAGCRACHRRDAAAGRRDLRRYRRQEGGVRPAAALELRLTNLSAEHARVEALQRSRST
jgi:hypothetical protein